LFPPGSGVEQSIQLPQPAVLVMESVPELVLEPELVPGLVLEQHRRQTGLPLTPGQVPIKFPSFSLTNLLLAIL